MYGKENAKTPSNITNTATKNNIYEYDSSCSSSINVRITYVVRILQFSVCVSFMFVFVFIILKLTRAEKKIVREKPINLISKHT